MTTAIFWRFLWKEYRVMRAFWISMAVLAVLAQLSLVAFPGLTHYPAGWTFSFALIFPALYAVACGATMFAAEKEDGTYEFLRSLPVTAWRLFSGKLAFAVVSTVLLIGTLLFTADLLMKGRVVDGATQSRLWGILGLAAIEGLAWGLFFSLILHRPLQAAILTIAAVSIAVELVVRSIAPWRHWDDLGPYTAASPYRAAIAALVLLIDAALVRGWLETRTATKRRLLPWPRRLARESTLGDVSTALPAARGAILGRLVWQTWRQSRGMMFMLGIGGAVLALLPFENFFDGPSYEAERARMILIGAFAGLMGACVFLADHERRSLRFLAEQAVRPRSVWLARELSWLAVLLVCVLLVHAAWFFLRGGQEFIDAARDSANRGWGDRADSYFVWKYRSLPPIAFSLYIAVGAFTCGQLASIFLRSGILAGFIGLVLSFVLFKWALFIQLLEISWNWSLVPIPFVLLLATWVRTPDWLLERNTWRGWLRVATVIALPLAALLVAVPLYRIVQIPLVSPRFSPEQFALAIAPTASGRETADMYRRAADQMTWTDWDDWQKLSNAEKQEWLERATDPCIAIGVSWRFVYESA